ncbi:MAG TPA: hypothetical protein VOB72_18300 [Candidatus Dormibacteraeota bacterium]|nr:hypothetical protein [Candidatus Dormibacteraeota bacterium]
MPSRRPLVALLTAALAFALQPAMVGHAGLDDSQNPGCPAVTAVPAALGKVVAFTGSLTCFRPGGGSGAAFGKNVAPADVEQRLPNPQLGDPCQNTYYYRVSFSNDTGGNAAAIFAFAGGATSGTFGIGSTYFTQADADMMGTHDGYVTDVQLGTYEPSNASDSNSPLTCQLKPTYHFFCPATGQLDQFCFTWVNHPITNENLPPQAWAPFFAQTIGDIRGEAGQIHSAPSARAVVNTPTCFWIDNIGIPDERDLTLVLPSNPDASGRQIFYTFLARIKFLGVDWWFDGDDPTSQVAPDKECLGHPQLVAHRYTQISDGRNGDDTYHVTATERYSITVDAFWNDSFGNHGPVPVDPGVAAPQIRPDALPQRVGQVEGIPIGSP